MVEPLEREKNSHIYHVKIDEDQVDEYVRNRWVHWFWRIIKIDLIF